MNKIIRWFKILRIKSQRCSICHRRLSDSIYKERAELVEGEILTGIYLFSKVCKRCYFSRKLKRARESH